MIKKWALAAVAYLMIVMIGYSVYASMTGPSNDVHPQEANHEMDKK